MGIIYATSPCFGCGRLFIYNPDLVPSIRVNRQGQFDPNGSKEPICQNCVDRVNPQRIANGVPPITVLPGAYEPGDESGLP